MSTRIGRPLRLAIIGLAAVAVVVVVIRVGTSDSDVVPATGAALEQSSVSTGPAKVEERGAARKQSIVPAEQAARPTEGIDPAVSRQHDLLSQEAAEPVSVEPDPDFQTALSRSFISTNGWRTDFSRHTVPFGEIVSGGPQPDGIPPLDSPTFVDTTVAATWLGEREPVIALEIDGDVRAYPLQILIWHEIVNDVVGGEPVTVTFCPLCNAAIVFERTLDGVVYDFGTSGYLRHSDLIMWDRQTHSWWQQFTGEGIIGDLAGRRLTFVPAPIVSFSDFESANPDGLVLSRETGFFKPYGRNPYVGYDDVDNPPFLYFGESDDRLQPKERVVTLTVGDVDAAFPFEVLEEERAVNYSVNGQDVAVLFKFGTASSLDESLIASSRDVGATGVFDPLVNGEKLTFRADGDSNFVDNETGSSWNILGEATDGPLAGTKLRPLVHANHFWFAWGAFKPDTIIYQSMS